MATSKQADKKIIVIILIMILVQGEAFMGSFYSSTLYPKELKGDVKKILTGRSYYKIEKKEDEYALVTEEKMDELDLMEIEKFNITLSKKAHKLIYSFFVYDSDVLWFSIYKDGSEIYNYNNGEAYFNDGKIVVKGNENISGILHIDKDTWEEISNEKKIEEYADAEDYLNEFIKILKLPSWVNYIGYRCLEADNGLIDEYRKDGLIVERNSL
jgi:hypothetical protein